MTDAGEGQVPVGTLLGRPPRRPPKWQTVIRWRDWKLPVKLAAITLVPIVIALVLGAVTIVNQVERSDSYQRIDRLVTLNGHVRTTLDGVQRERTATVAALTAGTGVGTPELDGIRAQVDAGLPAVREAATKAGQYDPRVISPARELSDQLDRLRGIRESAAEGDLDPVQAITDYTTVTSALLKVDTTLVAGISDDAIGGAPSAIHDLEVAKDELSVSQSLVGFGIARGNLAPAELNQLRNADVRLNDRLTEFRASANQDQRADYDTTVSGPNFDTRDQLVRTALGEEGLPSEEAMRTIDAGRWATSSAAVTDRVNEVSDRTGDTVTSASEDLVDESSSAAGLLAVFLFATLLLTAAVVFFINRQLLRSLGTLRSGALDIAESQLPAAVSNIQQGREQSTDVAPIAVDTTDEVGEVARAFDKVHSQALRLAVEQATMRTGYGTVFINLSRRSQSLVQRQLQMIERLERDEEDADQLATLFQLDHLATRMRRNNENLMVLSGAEPGRRSGQPVTTTDVLRAAVSEIEQYQRVVVQPPPDARIVGHAASDLMRLIAELLDNAAAFSAPDTKVTVAARLDSGALSVDILDRGIGMNEAEVADANERLRQAASVELSTSRRMGLFVVGRLASRHAIAVKLYGGRDLAGVRATVTVPAELVLTGDAGIPPRNRPSALNPPPTNGSAPLPRRQRSSNGAGRSGLLGHFSGTAVPEQGQASEHEGSPVVGARQANALAGDPAKPADVEVTGTSLFATPQEGTAGGGTTDGGAGGGSGAADSPAWDDVPSGKKLFAANSSALTEWWSSETAARDQETARQAAEPAPTRSETTPIFDQMLSVWFRSGATEAEQGESERQTTADWEFAADERWRTVQAVTRVEPETFTDAGLPRRRRGEQLLPGSAGTRPSTPAVDAPIEDTPVPVRDPEKMRGRLSSFQQGVRRGRGTPVPAEDGTADATDADATAPETAAPDSVATDAGTGSAATETAGTESPTVEDRTTGSTVAGTAATAAPGAERAGAAVPESDAEKTASLWTTPTPTPELPAVPAARTSQTDETVGTAGESPSDAQRAAADPTTDGGAAAWTFSTDETWRTVQSVSQSSPESYTQAGLPRRRRGEQLLPGSAASSNPTSNSAAGSRPGRDPHDVRGRLSSFQQGIRRGRHRSAQSADGNQEKVEGE